MLRGKAMQTTATLANRSELHEQIVYVSTVFSKRDSNKAEPSSERYAVLRGVTTL